MSCCVSGTSDCTAATDNWYADEGTATPSINYNYYVEPIETPDEALQKRELQLAISRRWEDDRAKHPKPSYVARCGLNYRCGWKSGPNMQVFLNAARVASQRYGWTEKAA